MASNDCRSALPTGSGWPPPKCPARIESDRPDRAAAVRGGGIGASARDEGRPIDAAGAHRGEQRLVGSRQGQAAAQRQRRAELAPRRRNAATLRARINAKRSHAIPSFARVWWSSFARGRSPTRCSRPSSTGLRSLRRRSRRSRGARRTRRRAARRLRRTRDCVHRTARRCERFAARADQAQGGFGQLPEARRRLRKRLAWPARRDSNPQPPA